MALIDRIREVVLAAPKRVACLQEIADGSGVPFKTVRNIYYGATKDMRHSNAVRIERFLNERYGRRAEDRQYAASGTGRQMR